MELLAISIGVEFLLRMHLDVFVLFETLYLSSLFLSLCNDTCQYRYYIASVMGRLMIME
jgi:hypothetical protein